MGGPCWRERNPRKERGVGGGVAGCLVRGWANCLDLGFVLICSGCYDKIAQTGWLGNNRNLSVSFLEAGCPELGRPHGLVLVSPRAGCRLRASGSVPTEGAGGARGKGAAAALTPS